MAKKSDKKNVTTTEPGTEDEAGKGEEEKVKGRQAHPAVAELGEDDRLEEYPPDFDFDRHKPIKRSTFTHDWQYFAYKSDECVHRGTKFATMSEEAKALGSTKERGKLKRLKAMQEKIAELQKELEGKGIDVEALLAGAST